MYVARRYQPAEPEVSRRRADELIGWLRDYGEQRIDSRLIDERRTVAPHVVLDFGNRGLFGIQVEERFGGLALGSRDLARVLEQAAAIDLGVGTFLLTSLFPGVRPIAAFAPLALRTELLPQLASGRMLAGYAQTEPGAGTHLAALTTEASELPGGGWRLSGHKTWIGNATWAGVLTTLAQAVSPEGRRRGLVALAVRTDQPGVSLGPELLSLGMRGMVQAEVRLRDVVVPPEHQLGADEAPLSVGVDSMSFSRFAIAATCVGAMRRCAQLLSRAGTRRRIATGLLLEHPVMRGWLGEMLGRIAVAEAMIYHQALLLDRDARVPPELFAASKGLASEFLWQSVDALVQALGSRGYDEANGAAQLLRDARVTRIFEGATEPLAAYVGSATLARSSPILGFLCDELGADALAARLERAVSALRERELDGAGGALPRDWACALAGYAAFWAIGRACLARAPDLLGLEALPGVADWVDAELDAALRRAETGDGRERAILAGGEDFEKAVARVTEGIGDVDVHGYGEKHGFDPLLRRPEKQTSDA